MTDVYFCIEKYQDGYIGGIENIINMYMNNLDKFLSNNYNPRLYAYLNKNVNKFPKKIGAIYYALMQRKNACKYLTNKDSIIHIHSSRKYCLLKDLLLAKYLKKENYKKIILSIHYSDINEILYRNEMLRKIEIMLIKHYVDTVVTLSNHTKHELMEYGIEENTLKVLYTFHDMYYEPTDEIRDNKPLNLLFVGSIDRRKGLLDLLKALKKIDFDYKLYICGKIIDKSVEVEFNSLLQELADRVIFVGYVKGIQKANIFSMCDVLILPSYGEGMPVVIMEALAMDCGIITTKVGAIPEILNDENAIFVKAGNTDEIAEAISYLNGNRNKLSELKNNNLNMARKYSLSNNIIQLCAIYDEVMMDE